MERKVALLVNGKVAAFVDDVVRCSTMELRLRERGYTTSQVEVVVTTVVRERLTGRRLVLA